MFTDTHASLKIYIPEGAKGYTGDGASANWKALADKIDGAEITWDIGVGSDAATVKATLSGDGTALAITGSGAMKDWWNDTEIPWYSKSKTIKTVTITDGITNIGNMAFVGCTALESITIPEGVTTIEGYVFNGCTELKTVTFNGASVPILEDDVFTNTRANLKIYIPEGATGYTGETASDNWKALKDKIFIPVTAPMNFTTVKSNVKCTDSDVATKITGMTPHTHQDSTPCWAWTYNVSGSTLALNNFSMDAVISGKYGIHLNQRLVTINFTGDNTIKVTATGEESCAIYNLNGLTLTGTTASDRLSIMDGEELKFGIRSANGVLTITEGIIHSAVTIAGQTVAIKGGDVMAFGENYNAIRGPLGIILSGGKVTAQSNNGYEPYNTEPILKDGMAYEVNTGEWNNITGKNCVYKNGVTTHTVIYTLTNLTATGQPTSVTDGNPLNATLTAASGYTLPDTIAVTMGDHPLARSE